jgi:signal peptidase II
MERSYRGLLWGLALIGLVLDQSSKYLIFRWLYNGGQGGDFQIIPGAFELLAQFSPGQPGGDHALGALRTWSGNTLPRVNEGALFGMKVGLGVTANTVFAIVSLVAAGAIIWWSTHRSLARDWSLCAALGLILGGTIGNLYDRVVFHGVRDFLRWYYAFEWPVFNVADCCLVCGAFLLLAQAFFVKHEQTAEQKAAEQMLEQQTASTPA